MKTWGPGIFDNDLAAKIRDEFNAALQQGKSVFMAGTQIKANYSEADSAIVNVTLAALQLEHDLIDPKIRKKALTVIILGEAMERWEGDAEMRDAHVKTLEELRAKLNAMG